ncbi:MAG: TetR/AcrR family transcriptional regulator [Terracidiphilus sp.]|nr:TetR/AcrR family transcriptional regulator [Terracidiphilus sp.]
MVHSSQSAPSERAAASRARILDAALAEFAAYGLAGARTESIARSAGVNKALLYYYFESKENLYLAALESISCRMRDASLAVLRSPSSAGERTLRLALNHFDRILSQTEFQSLLQQEMMRLHNGEQGAMSVLVQRVFAPALKEYEDMVHEGIESGELISVDWLQIHLCTLGMNVFYFLSSPVWRLILPYDPFDLEVLRERRRCIVEFIGQTIFSDRAHGAELAAHVLADTPMPEVKIDRLNLRGKNERA